MCVDPIFNENERWTCTYTHAKREAVKIEYFIYEILLKKIHKFRKKWDRADE